MTKGTLEFIYDIVYEKSKEASMIFKQIKAVKDSTDINSTKEEIEFMEIGFKFYSVEVATFTKALEELKEEIEKFK